MFALPMAELVGSKGRVYAVDNSEQMLTHIKSKNPPANLILINSDVKRTGLNNQIANMCLLAFILHEVKEPSGVIDEAFRLLKSDGKLIIVEWKAGCGWKASNRQILPVGVWMRELVLCSVPYPLAQGIKFWGVILKFTII